MTNQATRIIVKAAGDLAPESVAAVTSPDNELDSADESDNKEGEKTVLIDESDDERVDIETYKPAIGHDRSWSLSEFDLGK